jgi:RHS repeat-associated protein
MTAASPIFFAACLRGRQDSLGRTTAQGGAKANDFAHRFSTKPQDATTGLYYYGYRWYDPLTGRWPSRDPIEEMGGINLYGFVGNSGVNDLDINGLFGFCFGQPGINPCNGDEGGGNIPDPPPGTGIIRVPVTVASLDLQLVDSNVIATEANRLNVCSLPDGGSVKLTNKQVTTFANAKPYTIGHLTSDLSGIYIKTHSNGRCMWNFLGEIDPEVLQIFDFGDSGNHNEFITELLKATGWAANWNLGMIG